MVIVMSDIKKTDLYWIIKPIWDSKGYVQGYEEFRSIPSADFAQVRHGIWECGEENSWFCSECDEEFYLEDGTPQENGYHFCPNCGARMDEEVD